MSLLDVVTATDEFENWLSQQLDLDLPALERKHEQMRLGPFPFLRATFYRWVQSFAAACPEFLTAPEVLSVGDLHVENFGSWRDAEGRLIWGVNDYDEACRQTYASDLVRLGVSATLAIQDLQSFAIPVHEAIHRILDGYAEGLKHPGGHPFILRENQHELLRLLVEKAFKKPDKFARKLNEETMLVESPLEPRVAAALRALPPADLTDVAFRTLKPVGPGEKPKGLGSVGRRRFYLTAKAGPDAIFREAKAIAPSAWFWARQQAPSSPTEIPTILEIARHLRDPLLIVQNGWTVRRLAPDCVKVELDDLEKMDDPEPSARALFHAMGQETANIHLGSGTASDLAEHFTKHRPNLTIAIAKMVETTRQEQEFYSAKTA